jgi:hypothetical protein
MSNWKHRDYYPRERWGTYYEYQDMTDRLTWLRHLQHRHTKGCQEYAHTHFAIICRFTGEIVDTAEWKLKRENER